MIWRVLAFLSALTCWHYVCRERGEAAAWAAVAVMNAVLLPLSQIERRLTAIKELHEAQNALLTEILKGYL